MTSIVIGAAGIVGGYIVEQLVLCGEKPYALSRSHRSSAGVNWLQGDLTVPEALSPTGAEIIYCTVEIGLLADALPHLISPSLKRVVAFSSTSVITKIQSEIPEERALLSRMAEGERRLMETCAGLGIGWTILRPTIIYAEGRDGNLSRLAALIRKFGFLPLLGRGEGLRQPVHAQDLAIGAVTAAARAATINKTYILPGGEIVTYREMVGRLFDALEKPRRIISLPGFVWKTAFKIASPLLRNANAAMGTRMSKDMVFDSSEAIADLDWAPRRFRPVFPKS